jgi:hypothetical protein
LVAGVVFIVSPSLCGFAGSLHEKKDIATIEKVNKCFIRNLFGDKCNKVNFITIKSDCKRLQIMFGHSLYF